MRSLLFEQAVLLSTVVCSCSGSSGWECDRQPWSLLAGPPPSPSSLSPPLLLLSSSLLHPFLSSLPSRTFFSFIFLSSSSFFPLSVVATEMHPNQSACSQLLTFLTINGPEHRHRIPTVERGTENWVGEESGEETVQAVGSACEGVLLEEGICKDGVCRCWIPGSILAQGVYDSHLAKTSGIGRCLSREKCKSGIDVDLDNLSRLPSGCLNLLFCEIGAIISSPSRRLGRLRGPVAHWGAVWVRVLTWGGAGTRGL